jgi:hypothetical protein
MNAMPTAGIFNRPPRLLLVVLITVHLWTGGGTCICAPDSIGGTTWALIEADYIAQARAFIEPPKPPQTFEDARGAVDGIKNGLYAFHCGHEPNPWWQVDLGTNRPEIGEIVVYNRLDYQPGLHNADNLRIFISDNAAKWSLIHDNKGVFFGGVSDPGPLRVRPHPPVRARYVRLQIPSPTPIFFHLDEVEVYASTEPDRNIALNRPVDQSSTSIWSTAKGRVEGKESFTWPIAYFLARGRLLADDLRKEGVDVAPFTAGFDRIEKKLDSLDKHADDESQQQLYLTTRRLIRQLALSNPLIDFRELLFVKRFTQETYPDICLNHMPWTSRPGGDICILTLRDPDKEPAVRTLLNGRLGPGHVHGLDLWFGGDRIVFGYAKSATEQPPNGWKDRLTNYDLRRTVEPIHIFELRTDGTGLRRVTRGEWSDLDPTYAPNGDIIFVSERCGASLQCNEYDKDETSCNLFSCKPDGSGIRWLSVSKDGDYLPHTLDDGSIAYTRWEYQERGWANIQSIWILHPDGTFADAVFKQHLNDPWALEDIRSVPGVNRLIAIAAGHHTLAAGPVVIITPTVGLNTPRAIEIVTPGVHPPEGGMSGSPSQTGGVRDAGGFYSTPWALSEKYMLAAYSYSAEQTEANGYGLYLIDVFGTKELIYRDPAISSFIPIPLRPRPVPPVLPDLTDRNAGYATCALSSAAFGVDGVEASQARYLRIAQRLQWPYDNTNGGWRYTEKAQPNNWTPVRILRTVPLESDGSAHFRVPADTPVYFQLLDANQMEIRRMRSFISFQPGEVRGCVGCHETREQAPPSRSVALALRRAPSEPVPPPWGTRAVSFLRDIQPIFDAHCTSCHAGLRPAAGLDFSAGLTAGPKQGPGHADYVAGYGANRAYETIIAHQLVSWSPVQADAAITLPYQFGSHKSRLVDVLRTGACSKRAELARREWLALVTWIDANAPYHDRFVNKRRSPAPYSLAADADLLGTITTVHKKRCSSCHAPADVSRLDWIDIHEPARSRFLTAPLAASKAAGKCPEPTYANVEDSDYRLLLERTGSAVDKAWQFPRRDVQSLLESGPDQNRMLTLKQR